MLPTLAATAAALLGIANNLPTTSAQSAGSCLSLRGSTQCPSFQSAYVNPANLSSVWPFFTNVTDVASFDRGFRAYFDDPNQWRTAKLRNELQCDRTAVNNVTLQYERSWLCGQFTQNTYSAGCNRQNNVQPIMLCQGACLDFSASEKALVANPQVCASDSDLTSAQNATRYLWLQQDYVSCTDWTSLFSTNNQTCIEGASNEGNCGFGPGVSAQLCELCDPTGNKTVPTCCFDNKTDLSQCTSYGHPGAAAVRPTTSIAPGFASSTAAPASSSTSTGAAASGTAAAAGAGSGNANSTNLSGGALAGIIIGCIIGAAALGIFLAALVFKRRRERDMEARGVGGVYGSAARGSHDKWTHSDEGTARISSGSPIQNEKSAAAAAGAGGAAASSNAALAGGGAPLGGLAAGAGMGAAAAAVVGSGAAFSNSKERLAVEDKKAEEAAMAASLAGGRPVSGVTTNSGADGRGTTVAFVKDQYTGQDIVPGEDVIAIYPYNAALNDELTLEPEQRVTILRLYDDGWALGRLADGSGQEGALPLVCVSSSKGDVPRVAGGNTTGTSEDEGGLTSGQEYTSSVEAFTAEEGGFTSDGGASRVSRRRG